MKNKRVVEFLIINIGLVLVALSISGFLVPGKLAAGGVSGIATILYYFFKLPVGITMLVINIPLFILGIKIFGKGHGIKGLYGIIMLSVFVEFFDKIMYLDKIKVIASYNPLIATVYGGVIGGVGIGLVMSVGGNTGGTDILAQIINRYFKIALGTALILVDLLIIFSSALSFGIEIMLYAHICMYLTGKMINVVEEKMKTHLLVSHTLKRQHAASL